MNVVNVDQLLLGQETGPLRMRRLAALDPRPEPYFALLLQPTGTIHASAARIGNADAATALPMYRAFLDEAVKSHAQLAMTPEYSLPWTLVREIVTGAVRPPHGTLWILGCESITPAELEALRAETVSRSDVRLIHEPFDQQKIAQTTFVDPVVFVFWAIDDANTDVLCILAQFKTVPSRDPDHVELHSLYLGTDVYKFTAQAGDVSLLTLICSDAFAFNDALVSAHCSDVLLVHIQLNERPGHGDYAAYRHRLFSVASNNNVEVICLNWAANVQVEGSPKPFNPIAGSAWYISPRGLIAADDDVNRLHHDGLYYSIVGNRWHAFYLNYSAHTLLLRKQRVFANGPQAVAPRVAPDVIARRVWSAGHSAWVVATADDGFATFIAAYPTLSATLPHMCTQDPLSVERAVELAYGPGGNVDKWYTIKELSSLKVGEEESIRSLTVSQETDANRLGVVFRRDRARRAETAATIPQAHITWPVPVADLAGGFRYRWISTDPHSNVEPAAGGKPAALIYLGENPEGDTIANTYAKISTARKHRACEDAINAGLDPSDAAKAAEDRLCVVFRRNQTLEFFRPPGYASITDAGDVHANDIASEEG